MTKDLPSALKKLETELKLRGFSKQTSKMYLFYNQKFLEYIKKPPEDVIEDDIKDFLAYNISDQSLSNASIAL
ncbi:MAG: phage integrase N-terminal SAM-like domain-containing protein, partial [Candidatus Methanoperedens sp.]